MVYAGRMWPPNGLWYREVAGDPLGAAAELLAASRAPLDRDGPRLLVPNEAVARRGRAALRRVRKRSVVRADSVVSMGSLVELWAPLERLVSDGDGDGDGDGAVAGRVLLAEAARAVEAGIRARPDDFDLLGTYAAGGGLGRALAQLQDDLGQAGLHSRAAGSVAALEGVEPPGLGRELLVALGMLEGTIERAGWWSRPRRISAAARALEEDFTLGQGPWIVAGFDYASAPTLDVLRALARRNPVVWFVPLFGGPDGPSDRHPLRRSLAWVGAARLGPGAAASPPPSPHTSHPVDILQVSGPREAAAHAVSLASEPLPDALGAPARPVVLTALQPWRWEPLLREQCELAGIRLCVDTLAPRPGAGLRWVASLVEGWARGLTAARSADLHESAARLRLSGWPAGQGAGDRVDEVLRGAGVLRSVDPILAALGKRDGRGLRRALRSLDRARTARDGLEAICEIVRRAGFDNLALLEGPAAAQHHVEQVSGLVRLLEELAERLQDVWPRLPAHSPELLLARVQDAIADSLGQARAAPPEPHRPQLWLAPLASVAALGPGHVVCLGLSEAELRGTATTRLVPDLVRAQPSVAHLAHWPWASDASRVVKADVERWLSGAGATGMTLILPDRDVDGGEHVPWSRIFHANEQATGRPGSSVRRLEVAADDVHLRSPEIPAGPLTGQRAAQALGLDGRGASPTTLDAYRRCPRQLYWQSVERAPDREPVRFDIDSRQRGIWLHKLLQRLFEQRPGWWREARDVPSIRAQLAALDAAARADGGDAGPTAGASAEFVAIQTETFLDAVSVSLCRHGALLAGLGDVRVARVEAELEGMLGAGPAGAAGPAGPAGPYQLRARGTLDRVDIVHDDTGEPIGLLVIDYKTGAVGSYAAAKATGTGSLQLVMYALLAEQAFGLPCIAALAVPLLRDEPPRGLIVQHPTLGVQPSLLAACVKTDALSRQDFEHTAAAVLKSAFDVTTAIRAGLFPAEPRSERSCDYCSWSLYCPGVRQ